MIAGAADCHFHILDRAFALASERTYDPEPSQMSSLDRLLALFDVHGLTHGLAVGAEPYGTDNSCLLDAIARSGGRLKGIALVRPDASERELAALVEGGVIGIRFNLTSFGMRQFVHPATGRLFAMLREMDLFLQIHCEKDELTAAGPKLATSGLKIMIDHFGRPDVTRGTDQPGFRTMLELGRTGRCVVKLSGPFRCSRAGYPYPDVEPFIAAAVDAFTLDNCVWGSDWPFVRVDERIDYGPELACVRRWFPRDSDRRRLMWDNPWRLFGFASGR